MGTPAAKSYQLTEKEAHLIDFCRQFGFGKFIVHCENHQPMRIEEPIKSVKL